MLQNTERDQTECMQCATRWNPMNVSLRGTMWSSKQCPTDFNEILRKFFDKLKAAKGQALLQLTGIRAALNIAI